MHRTNLWIVAALATSSTVLSTRAAAQQWTVTVGKPDPTKAPQITAPGPGFKVPGPNVITPGGASLKVTCDNNVPCDMLRLKLSTGLTDPEAGASPTAATFTLPASLAPSGEATSIVIGIVSNPADVASFKSIGEFQVQSVQAVALGGAQPSLGELLAWNCRGLSGPLVASLQGKLYDRRADLATFVVTPVGNILARPHASIDEDDNVRIVVLAHAALLDRLRVFRSSATRIPTEIDIAGAGSTLPANILERKGSTGSACDTLSLELGDFAPGKGEVSLTTLLAPMGKPAKNGVGDDSGSSADDKPASVEVGHIDFPVSRLHTGALSFGVAVSGLVDSAFRLGRHGDDSVVSAGRTGKTQLRYAMYYTAFLWRRDYQKRPEARDIVAPSIGVIIDEDLGKNFLAGVSINLAHAIFLNVGAHLGRVPTLDPESGLKLGDTISGQASVPTTDRWHVRIYGGGSVDLRAAVELLKGAFGAASSAASGGGGGGSAGGGAQ